MCLSIQFVKIENDEMERAVVEAFIAIMASVGICGGTLESPSVDQAVVSRKSKQPSRNCWKPSTS
jgi:hypothetical protein